MSPRAPRPCRGQQIWCDSRADGHSPDERRRQAGAIRAPLRAHFVRPETFIDHSRGAFHVHLAPKQFPNVTAAIAAFQAGRPVLLLDDDDREDEADIVAAAENLRCRPWP
jgi:hypothetical protein